jgi:hypothetical protein
MLSSRKLDTVYVEKIKVFTAETGTRKLLLNAANFNLNYVNRID